MRLACGPQGAGTKFRGHAINKLHLLGRQSHGVWVWGDWLGVDHTHFLFLLNTTWTTFPSIPCSQVWPGNNVGQCNLGGTCASLKSSDTYSPCSVPAHQLEAKDSCGVAEPQTGRTQFLNCPLKKPHT